MSDVKEKITVSEFANKYNKLTNAQLKEKYVKEHIKKTYATLLSKMTILNLMNEKSVVDDSVKYIDLVVSKLNFVMAILVLYTDIEPDKSEDGKPLTWDAYDTLKSTGLLDEIIRNIGEEEMEELLSVQKNVMDTWHMQNKSTEAYITNLVEVAARKFSVIAGVSMDKLSEVLSDEIKMKKIISAFDKVLNKIK